jgi:hypothetical protein
MEDLIEITVLEDYLSGRLGLAESCLRLNKHRTTLWRRCRTLKAEGREALVHKLKGRRSNRAKPTEVRRRVLDLWENGHKAQGSKIHPFYRSAIRFSDLNVSYTTVRRWLKAAGLVN